MLTTRLTLACAASPGNKKRSNQDSSLTRTRAHGRSDAWPCVFFLPSDEAQVHSDQHAVGGAIRWLDDSCNHNNGNMLTTPMRFSHALSINLLGRGQERCDFHSCARQTVYTTRAAGPLNILLI